MPMEPPSDNNDPVKGILKTLTLIHYALLGGLGMFCAVSLLITQDVKWDLNAWDDPFFLMIPAAIVGGLGMSSFLYKQQLSGLRAKATKEEKAKGYPTACIIKWALLEGPALLGIMAFLMTGNAYYISLALLLILYFILQRPTQQKMQSELQLDR